MKVKILVLIFYMQYMCAVFASQQQDTPGSTTLYSAKGSRSMAAIITIDKAVLVGNSTTGVNDNITLFMDNRPLYGALIFGACVGITSLCVSLTYTSDHRQALYGDLSTLVVNARQKISGVWYYWCNLGALLISGQKTPKKSLKEEGEDIVKEEVHHNIVCNGNVVVRGNGSIIMGISHTQPTGGCTLI